MVAIFSCCTAGNKKWIWLDLIADSIIKFDPYIKSNFERKRNYWIILKKKDVILGPYSRHQYQHQRNELKVPETLQLDE